MTPTWRWNVLRVAKCHPAGSSATGPILRLEHDGWPGKCRQGPGTAHHDAYMALERPPGSQVPAGAD